MAMSLLNINEQFTALHAQFFSDSGSGARTQGVGVQQASVTRAVDDNLNLHTVEPQEQAAQKHADCPVCREGCVCICLVFGA